MNQQDKLEAQYRSEGATGDIPEKDPFPRMILVCIGITAVLLFVILGALFVDLVVLRPHQNVRQSPIVHTAPADDTPVSTAPATE